MRIAEVVGTVTLSRCHPSLSGASLRLAVPMSLSDLRSGTGSVSESIVVIDELGAGCGARIAVSEGAEAAQPFRPAMKPVDAYNAAILDRIEIEDE